MRIGFNYWMAVVPIMYVLGLLIGFILIGPGKRKALRRPFGWHSDAPIKTIMIFYSLISGVVTAAMLFIESRLGIIEVLGRGVEAIFLTPCIVMVCGFTMFYVTLWSMVRIHRLHRCSLKERWKKRRGEQLETELQQSMPEALSETLVALANTTHDVPCLTPWSEGIGSKHENKKQQESNIIAISVVKAHRRRRRWWQFWNDSIRMIRGLFARAGQRFNLDPMMLPDKATRKYKAQN